MWVLIASVPDLCILFTLRSDEQVGCRSSDDKAK